MDKREIKTEAIFDCIYKRLQLIKAPISILAAISVYIGCVLYDKAVFQAILISAGVHLITLSALTFNNIQDRKFDRLMKRTAKRPLATGEVSLNEAGIYVVFFFISGCILLLRYSKTESGLVVCLIAVFLYNFIYTPLKKKTLLALIPGLLSGMFPVYIGWIAAGGPIRSVKIIELMVIMGVWQIPHQMIIQNIHAKDYLSNKIPSISNCISPVYYKKLLFLWIYCLICCSFLIPFFGITESAFCNFVLFGVLISFFVIIVYFFFKHTLVSINIPLFKIVNGYMCILFLIIFIDIYFA